ncbi:MAG: hypothetical protein ACLUDU_04630 [Butyricimonas faecihominis]
METETMTVRVLGTEFNIKAYEEPGPLQRLCRDWSV